MNLNELRDILYDFQDTPANRNALCEELVATNTSDMVWGYAEQYIPDLEEWWDRQLKIQEKLIDTPNDLTGNYFDSENLKNLSGAYFYDANLRNADFSQADLTGADFSQADLTGAIFELADLRRADLSSADLTGADLSGSNLSGASLNQADLTHANVTDADLSGADLRHADLIHADLRGADLRGAWYWPSWLMGAIYNDQTVFSEYFDPESQGMVYEDESE